LTVTLKEHVAARAIASFAVHVTVVVPDANELPEAGVQLDVTGGVPPATVGAP
jgi:hypothetical protein